MQKRNMLWENPIRSFILTIQSDAGGFPTFRSSSFFVLIRENGVLHDD